MDKTSTNYLNAITNNNAMVEGLEVKEHADADELMFHHALRTELDSLQLKPGSKVIDNLLKYSKSMR